MLSFPLFMGATETPLALIIGEVFSVSRRIDCDRRLWERIASCAFYNQRMLGKKVASLLTEGKIDRAAEMLDSWIRTCTDSHLAVLKK